MIRGGEWLQEGSEFDAEMPGNRGSGVFGNGTRVVWYIDCARHNAVLSLENEFRASVIPASCGMRLPFALLQG